MSSEYVGDYDRNSFATQLAHVIETERQLGMPGDDIARQLRRHARRLEDREGVCPLCGSEPGEASFSTAPEQQVCSSMGCPVNTWAPQEGE